MWTLSGTLPNIIINKIKLECNYCLEACQFIYIMLLLIKYSVNKSFKYYSTFIIDKNRTCWLSWMELKPWHGLSPVREDGNPLYIHSFHIYLKYPLLLYSHNYFRPWENTASKNYTSFQYLLALFLANQIYVMFTSIKIIAKNLLKYCLLLYII